MQKNFFKSVRSKYQTASSMTRHMVVMLLLLTLLFGLIFSIKALKGYFMMKQMSSQSQVVTVSAAQARYEAWQPTLKATASLRAVRGVDVTTELAGLVRIIYFTPGSEVKKGALLVTLNIDSDVAQLRSLEAAAELAQITYNRDKAQFAIHAISKATLDNDAANLKSSFAQVAQQEATIAKKIIRAPFDGRLGVSAVNPGQYLNAGDAVVTLQSLNPIYVDFYVPQQALTQLKVLQPITMTIDTYPNQTFAGKITTIEPKVDPQTRNVQVEATVENPNSLLLPGMFGSVVISTGVPQHYITLPQAAISYNAYGNIVFIIKQTKANGKRKLIVQQSFVTTGPTRGDQVAVIKGLKAGDLAVTAGQLKLKNGSEVVINNTVVPSNEPSPHPVNK